MSTPDAAPGGVARVRRQVGLALPPVALGVAFVAAWQAWVTVRDIQPFVIPAPSKIWQSFTSDFGLVRAASVVTGTNALIGLLIGSLLGFAVAVVTNRFALVSEVVNPLAVTVAAIPAVVIVGVLNNMYALDSQVARRIMTTIAVFFVVFVQVSKGLRQNNPTHLELMRSYAASPRQVLTKVRLPNALSYFFTGVRTAAPLALIISLVSEYFGGPQNGLGTKIASTLSGSNKALGFAYVLGGSIVGLLFYLGSSLLEYVAVPWQRRRESR